MRPETNRQGETHPVRAQIAGRESGQALPPSRVIGEPANLELRAQIAGRESGQALPPSRVIGGPANLELRGQIAGRESGQALSPKPLRLACNSGQPGRYVEGGMGSPAATGPIPCLGTERRTCGVAVCPRSWRIARPRWQGPDPCEWGQSYAPAALRSVPDVGLLARPAVSRAAFVLPAKPHPSGDRSQSARADKLCPRAGLLVGLQTSNSGDRSQSARADKLCPPNHFASPATVGQPGRYVEAGMGSPAAAGPMPCLGTERRTCGVAVCPRGWRVAHPLRQGSDPCEWGQIAGRESGQALSPKPLRLACNSGLAHRLSSLAGVRPVRVGTELRACGASICPRSGLFGAPSSLAGGFCLARQTPPVRGQIAVRKSGQALPPKPLRLACNSGLAHRPSRVAGVRPVRVGTGLRACGASICPRSWRSVTGLFLRKASQRMNPNRPDASASSARPCGA